MRISDLNKEEFLEYQNTYGTDSAIAKIFRVSRQAVSKHRKKIKVKSTKSNLKKRNLWIIDQYNKNLSVEEISRLRGISISHVYKIISKRKKNG